MDDLLREFLTETGENLELVDVELVRFEQEPNNIKILENVFRLVHTIKGTCGFLRLPRLEALTHAAVREGLTVDQLVTIGLAGVIRWRPGAADTNGRWIQARAEGLMGGERQVRPGLRRAIVLNAALLAFVAVAAVVILVVALSHGF